MSEKKRGEGRHKRGVKRRHPDIEIARLLVKKRYVEKAAAMEALKEQKARAAQKKPRLPLVQLLVKKKVLEAQKVAQVQDEIRRHTYICNACDARVVLAPSSTRSETLCPRCGAAIEVEPPSGPSQSEGERKEFGSARELTYPGPPGLDRFAKDQRAFGRYELLEEIGRGAMGVVYRAKHVELGKEVALKVLLAGEDARDAQIARFRREAAAVQKLRHEGIVPIHDFGSEGEVYFLTMELVPGGLTLHRQWKDSTLAPPLKTRVTQIAKVAHAIDHANSRGVIHRDLKPANVLVGTDGEPRVADFGLAKDTEDEEALTLSQDRLGTPLFMAPEQVKRGSSKVDSRVDIWALGVMTFVAATGRYPFRGRTIMSLYMKILNEEPDWYGDHSSSPDRDGWGQAPSPREVRERLEKGELDHQATEVASHQGLPVRERPPVSDRLVPPAPFVPPPDTQGDVPKDLRSIIEMALAKDPERRYESAGALARDLERFARGEKVTARPPGKLDRLWRRVKRRRLLLVAAPILVLAPLVLFLDHRRREQAEIAARLKRVEDAVTTTEEVWGRFVGVGNPSFEAYEQAAEALAPVCSMYAEQPAPFIRRGLAHAFTLERDRARDDFVRAQANLESQPRLGVEFARAAALLARLRGEEARAAALARAGLQEKPNDVRLATFLGRALLAQGQAAEAENALAPFIDPRAPADLLALAAEVSLARNDPKKAFERAMLAQAAAKLDPEAQSVLGRAAFAQGQLADAREQLRSARESFAARGPTEARYFLDLAKNRRNDKKHRDLKGALEAGELAKVLAPWSPVPGYWRADLLRRDRHDPVAAAAELDECLARDPTFDEAAEIRAELLLARRDKDGLDAAKARFKEEIAVAHRERAALDLAVILIGEGSLDDAKPLLEKVEDRSLRIRATLLRSQLERRAGRSWKQLRAEFDAEDENRALKRRDLIALGRCCLIGGDASAALDALDHLPGGEDPMWTGFARMPASFHIVHALRAAAHAKLGDDRRALDELERAATKTLSDFAAEACPGVADRAPEFAKLKDSGEFQELMKRAHSE